MVNVRIEAKPAFEIMGRKTWISGQDNEQFGRFWAESHRNGLVERLRALAGGAPGAQTAATTFGVSCVDKDPNNRAFDFYIAAEACGERQADLAYREIPACTWAIFSNHGEDLAAALIEAELYAFMTWLPASTYVHDYAPELEVYPVHDGTLAEFWVPLREK